jgi:tetratricopeptide (TPR) repeat protein
LISHAFLGDEHRVSAAPRPATEEPGSSERPDDEGWALLDGLRRRLDDQASQTRKTQAQVSQLAESLAAFVELGRRRSRWLNLNSFVAYLVFTVLLGGAFFFVYQSRARELVISRDRAVTERDRAYSDRDAAVKRADAAVAALAGEKAAEAKAAAASAVDTIVKNAANALRAGRTADVIAPLEKALEAESPGPRAAQMHYLVGMAYSKGNQLDKAASHLSAAVSGDVAEEDARFQLASVLDRAGQWAKARGEYDKFATAHPQSPNAVFAMRRSATLTRMPAIAPWNGPQKPPAAPAPAAAAAPASNDSAP